MNLYQEDTGLNKFSNLGDSPCRCTTKTFTAEYPCDWHIWAGVRGQEGSGNKGVGKGSWGHGPEES